MVKFIHEGGLVSRTPIAEHGESGEKQVDAAWRLALGRRPRESEARGGAGARRQPGACVEEGESAGEARRRALAALGLVIDLNEFIDLY